MERRISGFFLMVLLVVLTACVQSKEKRPEVKNIGRELLTPDSTVMSILGDEVYDVFSNPTQVNVFTITPKKTVEEGDYEIEPHFVRNKYIGNITKRFQDVISYILLMDGKNYGQDEMIAQTFYLPEIEIEYKKKKYSVSVVLSPNDYTWGILKNGKKVFSGNYANKEIMGRLIDGLKMLGVQDPPKAPNKKNKK